VQGSPLPDLLGRAAAREGLVVTLTGAGISAESGIPTFRGPEGHWTVGSRNYRPMELATRRAFAEAPDHVWGWYLHRRAACLAARPNAAHEALASLDARLGDGHLLVTQNVDGLHLRAGHPPERAFQIHGNLGLRRCSADCTAELLPLPESLGPTWERGRLPTADETQTLACPRCGAPGRPHVLWFDESYDEPRFRFRSTLAAADRARLLLVIGTSGATNLPTQIVERVAARRVPVLVVDTEPTPFASLALAAGGRFEQGRATERVPPLAGAIASALA